MNDIVITPFDPVTVTQTADDTTVVIVTDTDTALQASQPRIEIETVPGSEVSLQTPAALEAPVGT